MKYTPQSAKSIPSHCNFNCFFMPLPVGDKCIVHLSGGGQATSQKVETLSALGFSFDGFVQAVDSYVLLLLSAYAQHRTLNHVVHPSCVHKRIRITHMKVTLSLRVIFFSFLCLPSRQLSLPRRYVTKLAN